MTSVTSVLIALSFLACSEEDPMTTAEFSSGMATEMCLTLEECSPAGEDAADDCIAEVEAAWLDYVEDGDCQFNAEAAEQCYSSVQGDTCDDLYDDAAAVYSHSSPVAVVCGGVDVCSGGDTEP